jgi:hypothetical protein
MKNLIKIVLISSIFSSFSSFARESKCILRVSIEIQKVNNYEDYAYCLDMGIEDEYNMFSVSRRYKYRGLSEKECLVDLKKNIIGSEIKVEFLETYGGHFEPRVYDCVGTVKKLKKIKYKPGK